MDAHRESCAAGPNIQAPPWVSDVYKAVPRQGSASCKEHKFRTENSGSCTFKKHTRHSNTVRRLPEAPKYISGYDLRKNAYRTHSTNNFNLK